MGEDFYDDPSIYDILHAAGTAAEVTGLQRMARRANVPAGPRRRWLEPACGTGRYLRVAARRGIQVWGFDRSESMIAYARQRCGPTVSARRLLVADMADFAPRLGAISFGFAFNLCNSVRHLRDDRALQAHLAQMQSILAPGGIYAVGLDVFDPARAFAEEDLWQGRRGRCRVSQLVQTIPPGSASSRRETLLSHLSIERPSGVEHRDTSYTLRTYTRWQWETAVHRSGFTIVDIVDEKARSTRPAPFDYGIYLLEASPPRA